MSICALFTGLTRLPTSMRSASSQWKFSALALARPAMSDGEYCYWLLRVTITEQLEEWSLGDGANSVLQELKKQLSTVLDEVHQKARRQGITDGSPRVASTPVAMHHRPWHRPAPLHITTPIPTPGCTGHPPPTRSYHGPTPNVIS
ncbi:hypothetical protein FA13DRAFT_1796940 [Coprinellus micaceus]|uniref:Uncharacterized protein n=1 Tax=Coprinellus micaceus TaxID=71717 RepID=A0A4Y7SS93_COPMI|nr:hypothetical protein FA13DRAFT_1796940 [Coprinellus micaceus]